MLKIVKNPTFRTTVPVFVPTDAGPVEQSLTVRYRVLPAEATELPVEEFLQRAVVSAEDVVDENEAPIAWSAALLGQLLDLPYMRVALIRGYWRALAGERAGN